MDDNEPCVAPELCIRCRSLSEHSAEVLSNADACTCPDDETCLHRKTVRKKKLKTPQPTTTDKSKYDDDKASRKAAQDDRAAESEEEDDDESSSSTSSEDTSCTSESEPSVEFRAATGFKV